MTCLQKLQILLYRTVCCYGQFYYFARFSRQRLLRIHRGDPHRADHPAAPHPSHHATRALRALAAEPGELHRDDHAVLGLAAVAA